MSSRFHISLFILFLSACALGCGKSAVKESLNKSNDSTAENNSNLTNNNPVKKNKDRDTSKLNKVLTHIDTTLIHIDTILSLSTYNLAITHEKFDGKHKLTLDDMYYNPISLYLIKKENDSVCYKQKFVENQFVSLYSFQNNTKHYVSLSSFGGGSGFLSTIYQIETEKNIQFKNVFTYNELTYYSFNTEGSEILCLQGIWDMFEEGREGEIGETHFADHTYEIITVDLSGTAAKTINHGTTKHKYPSEDSGTTVFQLYGLIQKKEPTICKNTHLDKYPL